MASSAADLTDRESERRDALVVRLFEAFLGTQDLLTIYRSSGDPGCREMLRIAVQRARLVARIPYPSGLLLNSPLLPVHAVGGGLRPVGQATAFASSMGLSEIRVGQY